MTAIVVDWDTDTDYLEKQLIYTSNDPEINVQFHKKFFRATANHKSLSFTTDFGNGLWEECTVKGITGAEGAKGAKGDTGDTGAKGDDGPSGGEGADGIFSAIASQGEAEAGVNNTKGMTPLRTKQNFDVNIATYDTALKAATITPISNRVDETEADIVVLQNALSLNFITGQQPLENNVAVAEAIVGADYGPNGGGNVLELYSSGAKSARIRIEMYRKDDAEERFTVSYLELHFIKSTSTWILGRDSTVVLAGDMDGVDFTVVTTDEGGGVYSAQVYYTSDNMVGGNYSGDSTLKFVMQETSNFF